MTISGNPCPDCAVWENRLLSISGATKDLPTVQNATDAGLFHPNCTHSTIAVGEFERSKYFGKDGRRKEGVNSPGRESESPPESWKAYRRQQSENAAEKAAEERQRREDNVAFNASPTPGVTDKSIWVKADDSEFPAGKAYQELKEPYEIAKNSPEAFAAYAGKQPVEYAACYDRKGNLYSVAKGDEIAVSCPSVEGGRYIHNHVNGAPFSIHDVQEMLDKKFSSMEIITSEKNPAFSLTFGKDRSSVDVEEIRKKIADKLNEAKGWKNSLENWDRLWREAFHETGIKYVRH